MTALRTITSRLGSTVRVVAVLLGLIAVAFGVSGLVAVRTLEHRLLHQIDDRIADDAQLAVGAIEGLGADAVTDAAGRAAPTAGSQALVVLDPDGATRLTAASGPPGEPDALPDTSGRAVAAASGAPFTVDAADGSLEYRAVARRTDEGFTVIVAAPLTDLHATVDALAGRLLLLGAVVVAVLGLLVWVVVRVANRQVDHMIDTAARIGSGDLTARVDDLPEQTAGGRLGHALNDMVGRLQTAFDAQQASDERLRRFAADASHELRTPLTHIRGYAELLTSGAVGSPEDQTRALDRIQSEAGRMAGLVDDLLLLARLDQGRPLAIEPVDLSAVVADAVHDARAVEPDRPIHLHLPRHAVVVPGDDPRLRQVLGNVLANIRTHTPPTASASVTLLDDGERAVLTVADEGPGMDPGAAARAFDRFYRAEDSRSRATGGSGLGLAITAALVHAHGGAIDLESEPGRGTTVTITLPRGTGRSKDQRVSSGPSTATSR
jgi:two-component system OmpR family sensor kinase